MMVPLTLVAAVGRNRVIGGENRLLWRLKSDLKRFRTITMGKPLVMGRKTFESIGRPLAGRAIIVLTGQQTMARDGLLTAPDLRTALALAQAEAARLGADEVIVAGGGEVYRQTIGEATRLRMTEVDLAPTGDVLFPAIDPLVWQEVWRECHRPSAGDELGFAFVDYLRR